MAGSIPDSLMLATTPPGPLSLRRLLRLRQPLHGLSQPFGKHVAGFLGRAIIGGLSRQDGALDLGDVGVDVAGFLGGLLERLAGFLKVTGIASHIVQLPQAAQSESAMCDRNLGKLGFEAMADEPMIFLPPRPTGELETHRIIGADVPGRQCNIELGRDQFDNLGVRAVAGEMFDNPPFDGIGESPHQVTPT